MLASESLLRGEQAPLACSSGSPAMDGWIYARNRTASANGRRCRGVCPRLARAHDISWQTWLVETWTRSPSTTKLIRNPLRPELPR